MEENKYYIPEIDELYIGFECEKHDTYFNDYEPVNEYRQHIMCEEDFDIISCYIAQYRVKYLDKQDLIELGFEQQKFHGIECFQFKIYLLYYFDGSHVVSIDTLDGFQAFRGTIKNKSELIKVLKMLGIK